MKTKHLFNYLPLLLLFCLNLMSCTDKQVITERNEVLSNDFFTNKIKPIFDTRCVACHSCYNSPCQLNLSSYEGSLRGASHDDPYDFPLVDAKAPTRLGVDAKSTKEWREKGFYSVLDDGYERSLLAKIIDIKRADDYKEIDFEAEKSRVCPDTQGGFNNHAYLKVHNMPYGLPKLTPEEIELIKKWVKDGATGPDKKEILQIKGKFKTEILSQIKTWESFLNNKDYKHQLSARYFYEHTFLAHLYFENTGKEFFRLVRSKNLNGPAIEIATTRPYDEIPSPFYYRFEKVTETLVSKTHIVFPLSRKILTEFQKDFIDSNWNDKKEKFPAYGRDGANPFETYNEIPRVSRYRFFLKNARYFIRSFMKGPVCRGQVALNVINDHFWLMFLDPKFDLTAKDDNYFNKNAKLMTPPAEQEDKIKLVTKLRRNRWKANEVKMKRYLETKTKFSIDAIWNGFEGDDKNALLTIYRHFDSSDVLYGAKGITPKTIWIMDYQIFEDVYYNLVAGYNLFGPVLHQLNTRLYMDLSRISSEDMFINFLTIDQREKVRAEWSREVKPKKDKLVVKFIDDVLGEGVKGEMDKKFKYQGSKIETLEKFKSKNQKEEFLNHLMKTKFSGKTFEKKTKLPPLLEKIAMKKHKFLEYFPDVVYLRLKNSNGAKVYTLLHNKFHYNVNMLFFEDMRRNPKEDTLDILPEYAASYPNFYLDIEEKDLQEFTKKLLNPNLKKESYLKLMQQYGVTRLNPNFWKIHDWFNNDNIKTNPVEGALFDLNRYVNY